MSSQYSDNSAILASALTTLIGSQVVTQSDLLHQQSNGINMTCQNINPHALHSTYLAGGAVSMTPQQNDDNSSLPCSSLPNYCYYIQESQQQFIFISNSQIISPQLTFQPPSNNYPVNNNNNNYPANHNNMLPQSITVPQQIQSQKLITITINIITLNGQMIPINNVPIISKISAIKFRIESKTRIPSNRQQLVYSGIVLKDNSTLFEYNILSNNSTINLVGQILKDVVSFIDSDFLDPIYDCDFTNVKDNKQFTRGSLVYRRPCGWKRIAIKVLNKYGSDNSWLGTSIKNSWRYDSDPMEWPVSYHGTDKHHAKSIAETGFDITKGKRFKFGYGIYSTPDINIAALYANKFIHNNEVYCLVFQNRVNPNTLSKINTNIGEYWISPKSDDIRPYGICIKKLGKYQN